MNAAVLLLAALSAGQPDAVDFPPQKRGDVTVELRITVPEEGAAPGQARLRLTLTFSGPETLEVQGPRLEDALAAWHVVRRASSWRKVGAGVAWSLSLQLEQIKPGQVPPPGVVVGVRASAAAAWQEVAWMEVLNDSRDVAPPDMLQPLPASPWPRRLLWTALALLGGLALVVLILWLRRRPRVALILSAADRALARLQPGALPPGDRPAERFAQAEGVVRDYLDEQFGLKTRQQTTREVLAAAAELPAEAHAALQELLARGEMVKFAGQAPSAQECERAVELARVVIAVCSAVTGSSGEAAPDAEPGKTVRVG